MMTLRTLAGRTAVHGPAFVCEPGSSEPQGLRRGVAERRGVQDGHALALAVRLLRLGRRLAKLAGRQGHHWHLCWCQQQGSQAQRQYHQLSIG